jgi:hypothetical protein
MGRGEGAWVARLGEPRALRYEAADAAADLDGHVRAGSGLRRWGERVVVVQDDVNALALLEEGAGVVTPLLLPAGEGGRRSFSAARGDKAAKMDLEACVVLPDGRLVALGSGSTPARERLVVVDAARSARVVDGGALYAGLRARVEFAGSELNIEGAAVSGDKLLLFQRGNGAASGELKPCNAVGELSLGGFVAWLDGAEAAPGLLSSRQVALGSVRGVPYGFTDAAALPDGRVAVLVGAEDSPDTYQDGEVLGAKLGFLDGEGAVLAEIVDHQGAPTRLKLEGLDFVGFGPGGALEFLVVADMDDPSQPALLAPLTLSWREGDPSDMSTL